VETLLEANIERQIQRATLAESRLLCHTHEHESHEKAQQIIFSSLSLISPSTAVFISSQIDSINYAVRYHIQHIKYKLWSIKRGSLQTNSSKSSPISQFFTITANKCGKLKKTYILNINSDLFCCLLLSTKNLNQRLPV